MFSTRQRQSLRLAEQIYTDALATMNEQAVGARMRHMRNERWLCRSHTERSEGKDKTMTARIGRPIIGWAPRERWNLPAHLAGINFHRKCE